jgi:molybdopterin converting factor small subunit
MREGPIMSASTSDTRAELFAALQALAEIIPEMRGGQLMAAVGELCADLPGRGLWDASDAELLEAVRQFRRNFEASTASLGTS